MLYAAGIFIIYDVQITDDEKPKSLQCNAGMISFDGSINIIQLHCYVDDERCIEHPIVNAIYNVEAKWSFDTIKKLWIA